MTESPDIKAEPTLLKKPIRDSKPGPWQISNIIDGRALRIKLTAAWLNNLGDPVAGRARAIDQLHQAMFRGRMIAQERLQQGATGLDTARLLAAVQDEVISALFDFTTTHVHPISNPTEGERIAIAATGGYGRSVLAPSSDIDILTLHAWKRSPHAENVAEYLLYALWDMGLKVGHAFRTPEECVRLANSDVTIKTSLLDMRYLCGDAELFTEGRKLFEDKCMRGTDAQFIADKLAERDNRHAREGNTRYVVEPNVKESKGGLRDLQTLFWLIKHMHGGTSLEEVMAASPFTQQDFRRYIRAAEFFWTVRCHLHYLTGRAEERLSFDLQPEIAARMGYRGRGNQLGVERFMKRYFLMAQEVGTLTRVLAAKLEVDLKKKPEGLRRFLPQPGVQPIEGTEFIIDAGRVSVPDENVFSDNPVAMVRLFTVADHQCLDVHPDALWYARHCLRRIRSEVRRSPEGQQAVLDALLTTTAPGMALRRMNEAGVLGKFLPEFGGIVCQTQFNMYHHYTVDEHSLRAVEAIADIEHGRTEDFALPRELFPLIENRRALYLAMLLHDTGKGLGDQQVEGEKTSRRAAKRLGLGPAEVDLVGWLVRNHLEMSETAQKRDLSDPRTISTFAQKVGDLEHLRLLYVLTVADISAVGPNVWNAWKGQLMADLYHNTAAALRGGRTDEASVQVVLEERAEVRRGELVELVGTLPSVMTQMDAAYWTSLDADELSWHAACLNEGGAVHTRALQGRGGLDVLVTGTDRVGLFAAIVGAIVGRGANIVSSQVFTAPDGQVIDTFVLQTHGGEVFAGGDPYRVEALVRDITAAIEGTHTPKPVQTRRGSREAAFIVEPVVQIHDDLSNESTVIDLSGRDRPALLLDVAEALAASGLSLRSAHVGGRGERVFDAFYVQTTEGGKLVDDALKQQLKKELVAILGRDEPDQPATPAHNLRQASAADSF
ncbi:MAG: [protein-PII] uridylyltransferase [Hyphomonadaceae bacterium]|nr:[protein-PII] uridylyltransferase [Hyphomonadaceae bacterium]